MNPRRTWTRYDLTVCYLVTATVIVAFIWLFADCLLRAPEYYPAWDQRNFYFLARVALSRVQSILAGEPNSWSLAGWGFASQYSALFGLPLVPVFAAFGESWYVYGMAVAVIYGTAATMAVGAISVVLLSGYRPCIVYLTFAVAAFVAVTGSAGWYSTIYYYPDIGDAFVLAIWIIGALLLLRRPTWQRTGVLILLTVAVPLYRRGLLFAWGEVGLGLAISAAIECWVDWRKSDLRDKRMRLRAGGLRIGHMAASAIIALGILVIPPRSFVREMLSIAANNAYIDYAGSPIAVMDMMLSAIGIIPLGVSTAGYTVGAIVFRRRRFEIIGLGIGAVLNLISWVVVLRQGSPQNWIVPGVLYMPLGIGLGVGALAEGLRGRTLVAALGTAFLLLFLNAGRLVDGAVSGIMEINPPFSPHLLQGRVAKLSEHRGMEGPFNELFARLGVGGPRPRKVLVVASSGTFNDSVVQSAAEALLGNWANSYLVFWTPVVDAKDKLLVTEIMDADYVLVGNPLQTVLLRGFNGLKTVRDMFLDHDAAALDFENLGEPVAFPGFSVSIYRRVRESDDRRALATVEALEAAVTQRGYGQPSWIEIGRSRQREPEVGTVVSSQFHRSKGPANDGVAAHNRIAGEGWPARYLSYDILPMGSIELRGVGETTCPQGVLLTLRAMASAAADRMAVGTTLFERRAAPQPFSLATVVPVSGQHLELEINPPEGKVPCDVTLEHLQLYPAHQSGS